MLKHVYLPIERWEPKGLIKYLKKLDVMTNKPLTPQETKMSFNLPTEILNDLKNGPILVSDAEGNLYKLHKLSKDNG